MEHKEGGMKAKRKAKCLSYGKYVKFINEFLDNQFLRANMPIIRYPGFFQHLADERFITPRGVCRSAGDWPRRMA